MRLYLVQHGDALPKDVDPDRHLSDQGRADVQNLTDWLASRNVQIERILHSGKARAGETAEILRPLLAPHGKSSEGQGLAPNDSPEAFLRQMRGSEKDTLVVSHLPFVARIVSQALTGAPDRQLVDFVPGSIAGIERAGDASWRIFVFARPEHVRSGEDSNR